MEFSANQLNKLAQGLVQPGEVYRIKLTESEGVKSKSKQDNGRNKYFVVLGIDDTGQLIGFVLINTDVNEKLSQELKDLHYKITAADYPFLEKDRYICCSELKQIEITQFFERFQNKAVKVLESRHLEVIKNLLAQSPRVSHKTMCKFGLL